MPIQSYEDVPFSGPKEPICPEQNFIGINHYYYCHLPIGPFHCAKFKKFLQRIQNYEDAPFLGPKWSICPKQIFLCKIINIILIYLLTPYPELWGCTIFRPKMAYYWPFGLFQMRIFFRKRVYEPCFFHLCLSISQKSKSDINLLVKYWKLKNTEISLAESHFWL